MNFLIRGKGKVGRSVAELLDSLRYTYQIFDDNDKVDNIKNLISWADKIVVSPGIKPTHTIYQLGGSKIIGELDLIYYILKDLELRNVYFVGITGTDGKSTTTWKVYNILSKYLSEYKIFIGGNFDEPISSLFKKRLENYKGEPAIFILEVSSFMAYNLENLKFVGSFWTNFAYDHLDWHKDLEDYWQAKQNLLKNTIILKTPSKVFNQPFQFFKTTELDLEGFIKSLLSIFGKKVDNLQKDLQSIPALPHRFELVKQIDGINIYDDGKCTTANCQVYALNKLSTKCVLICGGFDKGIDYSSYEEIYKSKVGYAILFGDVGEKLAQLFTKWGIPNTYLGQDFDKAIKTAIQVAKEKGIQNVLFSPGASSFDMFDNRHQRAERFLQIINNLSSKK